MSKDRQRRTIFYCANCCPGHECSIRAWYNGPKSTPQYCIIDGHRTKWEARKLPTILTDITEY